MRSKIFKVLFLLILLFSSICIKAQVEFITPHVNYYDSVVINQNVDRIKDIATDSASTYIYDLHKVPDTVLFSMIRTFAISFETLMQNKISESIINRREKYIERFFTKGMANKDENYRRGCIPPSKPLPKRKFVFAAKNGNEWLFSFITEDTGWVKNRVFYIDLKDNQKNVAFLQWMRETYKPEEIINHIGLENALIVNNEYCGDGFLF